MTTRLAVPQVDATALNGVSAALANDLRSLERAVDTALIQASQIVQSMTEGRLHVGLSATVGQSTFEDAALVIGSLTKTRGDIVGMHNRMARQAERLGVDPVVLNIETKPADGSTESPFRPKG